ncbi:MAG: ATP-binding cassette domain-containing protein [Burkholderiales bacterium]|nr:ATP-binding cassette domain-containing protein [Burkholderiales bacterium]
MSLDQVSVAFHRGGADERVALDSVTLTVPEGQFSIVIGSNGAGKSTLLNAVSGVVAPHAGRIAIDGEDCTAWPEHRRARRIARVMQDPMRGTLPALTVEENLALAEMRSHGRGLAPALTARRRARYAEALAFVGLGLEERLASRVGLLSGGQRQVLALAMAVLDPPRLLLLDEHCAALDPRTAERVMDATLRAAQSACITTLMVTHNMQHAIAFGDRVLMMDAGAIRLDLAGEAKRALTVETLIERFRLADDKMLLAARGATP